MTWPHCEAAGDCGSVTYTGTLILVFVGSAGFTTVLVTKGLFGSSNSLKSPERILSVGTASRPAEPTDEPDSKVVLDPFLSPVEEDLFLICVEFAGDVERAAEVVPKLVVLKRRHMRCQSIRVARPGVGVEGVVLKVFIGGTVEVLRASLSDNANLRTGRAA